MISLILPVHNEAENLPFLFMALNQHLSSLDHETIWVNDGSTDGSGEMLDAMAAKDPRVSVFISREISDRRPPWRPDWRRRAGTFLFAWTPTGKMIRPTFPAWSRPFKTGRMWSVGGENIAGTPGSRVGFRPPSPMGSSPA
jgi:glycosyltransferase involved in cell wall biosynthesis